MTARRIAHALGTASAFAGAVVLLGAIGVSDVGAIEMEELLRRAAAGGVLLLGGVLAVAWTER